MHNCTDAQLQRAGGGNCKLLKLNNSSQLLLANTDRVVVYKLRCETEYNFPLF